MIYFLDFRKGKKLLVINLMLVLAEQHIYECRNKTV